MTVDEKILEDTKLKQVSIDRKITASLVFGIVTLVSILVALAVGALH